MSCDRPVYRGDILSIRLSDKIYCMPPPTKLVLPQRCTTITPYSCTLISSSLSVSCMARFCRLCPQPSGRTTFALPKQLALPLFDITMGNTGTKPLPKHAWALWQYRLPGASAADWVDFDVETSEELEEALKNAGSEQIYTLRSSALFTGDQVRSSFMYNAVYLALFIRFLSKSHPFVFDHLVKTVVPCRRRPCHPPRRPICPP